MSACRNPYRFGYCEVCKTNFPAARTHARTCGAKCRQSLFRQRVRARMKRRKKNALGTDGHSFQVQRLIGLHWAPHLNTSNVILARVACRELWRMGEDARVLDQEGRLVFPVFPQTDDDRKALATG